MYAHNIILGMLLNPTDPRTCQDIGIKTCCNDVDGRGICRVYNQSGHCSCNLTCHQRKYCPHSYVQLNVCIVYMIHGSIEASHILIIVSIIIVFMSIYSSNMHWSRTKPRLLHRDPTVVVLCQKWKVLLWQCLLNSQRLLHWCSNKMWWANNLHNKHKSMEVELNTKLIMNF